MSIADLSFSVCRTERRPEEIIPRRHQAALGHGQRLRKAPASSGVTGPGRRRRYRGIYPAKHCPSRPGLRIQSIGITSTGSILVSECSM
ncbi:unnamed protein product [Coccothraustes coccothraustes]